MYRVWNFLTSYSLLLIIGALIALLWANLDLIAPVAGDPHYYFTLYHHMVDFPLWQNAPIGVLEDGSRTLTPHYLLKNISMGPAWLCRQFDWR